MIAEKLAIIAGSGPIPGALIAACVSENRSFHVLAIKGETDPESLVGVDHTWHDIAGIGGVLKVLAEKQCSTVCLVGPIKRPDFKNLRPDLKGLSLLPRILTAAREGDDAILNVAVTALEEAGFRVVGAEQILQSSVVEQGTLTNVEPNEVDLEDIRRGMEVLDPLGRLDIGQAVVIRGGQVLAVEAAEGTDEMLNRCRSFRNEERAGVLVKLPKPDQERRVDLPTIGLTTLKGAVEAGLNGIAVEAVGTLLIDRKELIERANAERMFVIAIDPGSGDDNGQDP